MLKRKTFVAVVGAAALVLSACSALGQASSAESCQWDLERLAAQVVVVPVDQADVASGAAAVEAGAGGVILFGKHPPQDLHGAIAALMSKAGQKPAPSIMVDEEGGAIQRLAATVGQVPAARWMGDHWSPVEIEQAGKALGQKLQQLGVSVDLAPVVDLDADASGPSTSNAVGSRSFGGDPGRASTSALAFARGLQAAGVTPVAKHFPGLGGATGNTDDQVAQTPRWDRVKQAGLQPFNSAVDAGVPAIMLSNAVVPGLTSAPASLSSEAVKVLRDELGFKGMIMTDSLSVRGLAAAGYTLERAAVLALQAGADFVLWGGTPDVDASDFPRVTGAIVQAVNDHQLGRDRLVSAVNSVLASKHLAPCGA